MEKRFKLVCVEMGSGWPSGHVAVDRYHQWEGRAGGNEICLNGDTDTPAELEAEIDSMIAELTELKSQVRGRFDQWQKLFRRT